MSFLPQNMELQWFGHSSFALRSPQGLRVLIDPWIENPKAPEGAKERVIEQGVDLILLTHGHSDHVGNTVEIAQKTGAKVAAIYEVMLFLAGQGVPQEKLVGMNKGGTYRERDLRATMVNAVHSSGIDVDGKVFPGGEAAGFVLRFDQGYTIYHAGDTTLFAGIEELITNLYHPDLLLVPIDDLFTMGPDVAAIFTKQVNPQHVVPIHWGTFPLLMGTPEAFLEALGEGWGDRLVTMNAGDKIS